MADPQWWPVDNVRITGEFGADADWYMQNVGQKGHNGIDITGEWGTPLYAIDDGVVVQEGWDIPWSGVAGGIAMIVRCTWGFFGLAHCADTRVSVGDEFRRGYRLGSMGNTGLALGVHVHTETLPLSVNFNNGFSGRVNPYRLINLQPRGAGSAERLKRDIGMSTLYYRDDIKTWALAGESPGTSANWLQTEDQGFANRLAQTHGNAKELSPATWDSWKAAYLEPLKIAGGQSGASGADQKALEAASEAGSERGARKAIANLTLKSAT